MKNRIIILSIFIFLVSILIIVNVVFHESLHDELADQYNKQQLLIAKAVADSIYAYHSQDCWPYGDSIMGKALRNLLRLPLRKLGWRWT
jgi:hypothetical protein